MSSVGTQDLQVTARRFRSMGIWASCIVALVICGGIVALAVFWPAAEPRGPALHVSTAALDLGEGLPGAELSGTFEITNQGTDELVYRLQATCGCTELTPKEGTIQAGDSRQIVVALRLPSILGANKKAGVFINSNDPQRPRVNCRIRGKCPFPFRVTPARIRLNVRPEETDLVQRLTVEETDQLRFRNITDLKINVPNDHCSVTEVRQSNNQFLIDFSINTHPDQRNTKFYISLRHVEDDREMHIPVQLQRSESVIAIPKKLLVHWSESEQTKEVHAWIVAKNGTQLRNVTLIDVPDGIEVIPESTLGNKIGYKITIDMSQLAADAFTLKYKCNHSEGECVLVQDFDINRR